jgi:hypothetical protein
MHLHYVRGYDGQAQTPCVYDVNTEIILGAAHVANARCPITGCFAYADAIDAP